MMLDEQEPSTAVLEWCRVSLVGVIVCPLDRPWFRAEAPPLKRGRVTAFWEYRCHCRRGPVRVEAHTVDGAEGSRLFVGQCLKCQAILWAYYPGEGKD